MHLCAEVYHISFTEWLKWSEGDRQRAMAWEIRKRQTCGNCGTRSEEWQNPKIRIRPDKHQCIGCRELARMTKSIPSNQREFSFAVLRRIRHG